MAIFAVGDLQGCLDPLLRLLDKVAFDPAQDRLWLVGDLVNRGPQSLECLREVRRLGDAAITVLGNHDLHLLATAAGVRPQRPKDTLSPILQSHDAEELLDWLARRPLLHHDARIGWTLVHAGIPPEWTLETAREEAAAVHLTLYDPVTRIPLLRQMYADEPDSWSPQLKGVERLRYAINALTRMRFLTRDGRLEFMEKRPPEAVGSSLRPWFEAPKRKMRGHKIVFGHWSALGLRNGPDWLSLDSGCVWGRKLTMVRLEPAPDLSSHPIKLKQKNVWKVSCP